MLISTIVTMTALSQPLAAKSHPPDRKLRTALSLDTVTNGVATTHDGRIFLVRKDRR
jgi:hypothetical protein